MGHIDMGEEEEQGTNQKYCSMGSQEPEKMTINHTTFFLKMLFMYLDLKYLKCFSKKKKLSKMEMFSQNTAFHCSRDYSNFLHIETLPTKRNQQEKHRRQQNETGPDVDGQSLPTDKKHTRYLCAA